MLAYLDAAEEGPWLQEALEAVQAWTEGSPHRSVIFSRIITFVMVILLMSD